MSTIAMFQTSQGQGFPLLCCWGTWWKVGEAWGSFLITAIVPRVLPRHFLVVFQSRGGFTSQKNQLRGKWITLPGRMADPIYENTIIFGRKRKLLWAKAGCNQASIDQSRLAASLTLAVRRDIWAVRAYQQKTPEPWNSPMSSAHTVCLMAA